VYVAAAAGAVTFRLTVTVAPGATSAPSAVRAPSHTTVAPVASCQ
jgi:hypothetical protein